MFTCSQILKVKHQVEALLWQAADRQSNKQGLLRIILSQIVDMPLETGGYVTVVVALMSGHGTQGCRYNLVNTGCNLEDIGS